MISAILFISFFIFLILGVPIGICLGLSSVCAILYSGTSLTIVATNMYSGISKFLLLAIPFFVLSGNIMAKAGISKRLIKFVDTCVGHKKGNQLHEDEQHQQDGQQRKQRSDNTLERVFFHVG